MLFIWWALFIGAILLLSYKKASLSVWSIAFFLILIIYSQFGANHVAIKTIYWLIFIVVVFFFNVKPIRRNIISKPLIKLYRHYMPKISRTEREAIEAGTVSLGRQLFSGDPKWQEIFSVPRPKLTEEEEAFLNGPVNQLCGMIDEWAITHIDYDLPESMWAFIKEEGFFSFIIPKKYGGKEFSAFACSEILARLYGRSITVGSTVAVPNSLGPGELLLHYGTQEQKTYYLPRLASGEEVPCFALTSPVAGSDAGSIPDTGIICHGEFEGKNVIGMRLTWDKRYITLAPVATILGLAFRLFDPEHLIGDEDDLGITCALIPTTTPGVIIGRRHFPLDNPFMNGPTQGKDIFVPLDWIIGGVKMAGQGWRMLMECLSTGRGITLPSSAVGGAKLVAYASGAYARIREQFNLPIGRFEGVEEKLTQIVGHTYMIDAMRRLTASLIDNGEKPAVATAIAKYHTTELSRKIANDAMDIHGGKGICLGPKNYLGRGYQGCPISITVEGANILMRSMVIFGQGAIRCHPYILDALHAAQRHNKKQGLIDFDKVIFGHVGFIFSNFIRAFLFAITRGYIAGAPRGPLKHYYQVFTRFSTGLALATDLAISSLGAGLKRKEKISGRLSDIFSYLFIGMAVLKYHHDQGEPDDNIQIVKWICQDLIFNIKKQFRGLIRNFPNRIAAFLMRLFIFPFGYHLVQPNDKLGSDVAAILLSQNETRERLTEGIYLEDIETNPIAKLKQCFEQVITLEPLEKKIKQAMKKEQITGLTFEQQVNSALKNKIISDKEAERLLEMHQLRLDVIAVDDFPPDNL